MNMKITLTEERAILNTALVQYTNSDMYVGFKKLIKKIKWRIAEIDFELKKEAKL